MALREISKRIVALLGTTRIVGTVRQFLFKAIAVGYVERLQSLELHNQGTCLCRIVTITL